ncbi:MAG: hypothetical protein HW391_337 [Chloroflexi bacterium]|nr:hypothetical protein [Chloroflexota bacterium]
MVRSHSGGNHVVDQPRHPSEVRLTILTACLSCGTPARSAASTFCGRCGRPFGEAPPAHVELPVCPVCYRSADDDGRFPSAALPGLRLDIPRHVEEHDQHPVGDDDYLESLREGSRIRIGRWSAPFDLVRRYLVTGSLDGGRRRQFEHDLIVTAMTQLARFGPDAEILGDQPEWRAARDGVAAVMERYHR